MKTFSASEINKAIKRGIAVQREIAEKMNADVGYEIVEHVDRIFRPVNSDLNTMGVMMMFYSNESTFEKVLESNSLPVMTRLYTGTILDELVKLDPEIEEKHNEIIKSAITGNLREE